MRDAYFRKPMFIVLGTSGSKESRRIGKIFENDEGDLSPEEINILCKEEEINTARLFKDLVEYLENDCTGNFGDIKFSYDSENVHITFSTPYIDKDMRVKYPDIDKLTVTAVFEHSLDFIKELKVFIHCLETQEFE
jgi:hypothetical protein